MRELVDPDVTQTGCSLMRNWLLGPRVPALIFVLVPGWFVAASDEKNTYEEGCLSIPEHFADVTRPAEVEVAWIDRDGNPQAEVFGGLWATCVQHEIDHLDGKLFIDYLTPLKRQLITRKMQKLKRERTRV